MGDYLLDRGDPLTSTSNPSTGNLQQRTPHKCPKCDGKGWLSFDPAVGPKMLWQTGDWWHCDVCESGIIWSKP